MPLCEGTILITGITGLVGSAVALEVAKAGFKLRGTSRSQIKAEAWSEKHSAVPVEWVIIEDQATLNVYDEAVKGVVGVIHVAGPFWLHHKSGEEIMKPQIEGTLSILSAASKEQSVRRVVYTSTVAAIMEDPHLGHGSGMTYTEANWNHTDWKKGLGTEEAGFHPVTSYCAGKTLAEKAGWDFMQKQKPHFDWVSLCPSTAYGPILYPCESLQDPDTASARLWEHIQHAKDLIPSDPSPVFTDLRDTAEAHLKALLYPSAGGQRYQLISGYYSYARIFAILKEAFPNESHRFPSIPNSGLPLAPWFYYDCSKAEKELQWRPRRLEETIKAHGKQLFDLAERCGA